MRHFVTKLGMCSTKPDFANSAFVIFDQGQSFKCNAFFFVIDNFFVLAGLARIFDWPPTFLMRSTQSSQLVSISRLQVARKKEGIFADFSMLILNFDTGAAHFRTS